MAAIGKLLCKALLMPDVLQDDGPLDEPSSPAPLAAAGTSSDNHAAVPHPIPGGRYLVRHATTGEALERAALLEDGWIAMPNNGHRRSALPSQERSRRGYESVLLETSVFDPFNAAVSSFPRPWGRRPVRAAEVPSY